MMDVEQPTTSEGEAKGTMIQTLKARLSPATLLAAAVLFIVIGVLFVALRNMIPVGVDWNYSFHGLPILNPYAFNETRPPWSRVYFPPWTMFFLPHTQLDVHTGNAINYLLNLLVPMIVVVRLTQALEPDDERRKHRYKALFLTYTSPFYLQLMATNNIDWLPLLAFLLPETLSGIILVCKPQAVGGAFLIFVKRTRGMALIPLAIVIVLSFVVWPGWMTKVQMPPLNVAYNVAPFPLMIPLGLYLLWQGWKGNDEVLTASATPFLVPYMTPYAASANMTLIAARYQKTALMIWLVMWVGVGIGVRGMLF